MYAIVSFNYAEQEHYHMSPELAPGQKFEFVAQGFNDTTYTLGVAATQLTICSKGTEAATLPGLGEDHHALMRFIAGHLGTEFRAGDVYRNFIPEPGSNPRDRFNAATFKKTTGLHSFVTEVTGPGNLWRQDGKVHQVGIGIAQGDEPQSDSSPSIEQRLPVHHEYDLTRSEVLLFAALQALQPAERTSADQLFGQLCERLGLGLSIVERTFRTMASKINARSAGSDPLIGLRARGKGSRLTLTALISPSVLRPAEQPAPEATDPQSAVAVKPKPAAVAAPQPEGKTRAPKPASKTPNTAPYAHELLGLLELPPEIDWSFTPEHGLVIADHKLSLQSDAQRLITALYRVRGHYTKMGNLLTSWAPAGKTNEEVYLRRVRRVGTILQIINLYAPVVVIDNKGSAGFRNRETTYAFNMEGTWEAIRRVTAGRHTKDVSDRSTHYTVVAAPKVHQAP